MSNQPAFLYRNVLAAPNELSAKLTSYTTVAGTSGACSMVGVARPDRNGSLTVQKSSDNATWSNVESMNFAVNECAFKLFSVEESPYWRVVFDAATKVAVIKLGEALRMTQRNYQGVTPALFNQTHNAKPGSMNRGQWLGRQTHGRVAKAEYTTDKTKMSIVRSQIMEMVEELREGMGVFYAWRPEKYPQDVIYGHLSGSVSPSNAGTLDFMDLSIGIEGIYNSRAATYDKPAVVVP